MSLGLNIEIVSQLSNLDKGCKDCYVEAIGGQLILEQSWTIQDFEENECF